MEKERKFCWGWLADGLWEDKDWFGGGCKSETVLFYINVLVSRKMFCGFSAFTILLFFVIVNCAYCRPMLLWIVNVHMLARKWLFIRISFGKVALFLEYPYNM